MTLSDRDAVAAEIETFVRRRFQVNPADATFSRTAHLWEDGYVDSMGVIELIHFLEQTFEVAIPESALFSTDFTTVDGISRVVAELRNGREGLRAAG